MSDRIEEARERAAAAFKEKHGHEDPAYLDALLAAAYRQAEAVRQVVRDLHQRRAEALRTEWDKITDEQIMEPVLGQHLRRRIAALAHQGGTDSGLYNRLQRLLPKAPASLPCTEGGDEDTRPSLQLFYPFAAEDWIGAKTGGPTLDQVLASQAVAVKEIGELWACGRRLIKVHVCTPDAPPRWRMWIEYEPATERARVMTRSRSDDLEQVAYGDLPAALLSAEGTARIWKEWP